jgi:hypothetical protein
MGNATKVPLGRPTKMSRAVADRIIEATRGGATREAAAAAGPIARSTLYMWLRQGRLYPDSREGYFVAELDAAEDEAERRCIALWQGHFERDWRAIAEFMGRRWPDRWGRQPTRGGPDGPGVVISDDERAKALCERLERWLDEQPDE